MTYPWTCWSIWRNTYAAISRRGAGNIFACSRGGCFVIANISKEVSDLSYSIGWAALNLEMPERVPRTEFSLAEYHWPLISRVTGKHVTQNSPADERAAATRALREAWTFDFNWSTLFSGQIFGGFHTSMGHADYAENGADFDGNIYCPFSTPEEVLAFDPWEQYGEIDKCAVTRQFEEHYRANLENLPHEVAMTGIYTTLMSGMIDIFGWDMLLMAAGVDPQGFGKAADRYASWMQQYMDALAEADVPCVMIHDDIVWTSGAFIHPDWYRKHIFPNYKKYFRPIIESGKRLMFTSDGDFTQFIYDIADAGVSGFVMEPCTDMEIIARKYGRTHSFIGNADTRILLSGTREAIEAEVKRCMDIGKSCPGFIMAVGNHIPANTPVENCLIYEEAYRKLCRR